VRKPAPDSSAPKKLPEEPDKKDGVIEPPKPPDEGPVKARADGGKSPTSPTVGKGKEKVEKPPRTTSAEPLPLKGIEATLKDRGNFKTLLAAARKARLLEQLHEGGPFTVFAPTDKAFDRLAPEFLDSIMEDAERLDALLRYHGVRGKLSTQEGVKKGTVRTMLDRDLQVKQEGVVVLVNNARVVESNVDCAGDVLHIIDAVLLPRGLEAASGESANP